LADSAYHPLDRADHTVRRLERSEMSSVVEKNERCAQQLRQLSLSIDVWLGVTGDHFSRAAQDVQAIRCIPPRDGAQCGAD
jgi:hypothetical protein